MPTKIVIVAMLAILQVLVLRRQTTIMRSVKQGCAYSAVRLRMPDYSTSNISAKVMGGRLAGILYYVMENYQQSMYDRRFNNSRPASF